LSSKIERLSLTDKENIYKNVKSNNQVNNNTRSMSMLWIYEIARSSATVYLDYAMTVMIICRNFRKYEHHSYITIKINK